MDNGTMRGGEKNAREFTEQIERAANIAAGLGDTTSVSEAKVDRSEGRVPESYRMQIGREAISSTGETSTDTERERAATELERDQEELTDAERFVGEESKLQVREREQDDQEDLKDETGQGIKYVGKIMGRNQTEIAGGVMAKVNEITKNKVFHPLDVVDLRRAGMHQTLKTYGRSLGDRN